MAQDIEQISGHSLDIAAQDTGKGSSAPGKAFSHALSTCCATGAKAFSAFSAASAAQAARKRSGIRASKNGCVWRSSPGLGTYKFQDHVCDCVFLYIIVYIYMSNGLNLLHPRKDAAEMVIVFCVSPIVPEGLVFVGMK